MNETTRHTNQKRGKFIVLEGGDGSGKSTNLAWIQQYLHQQGVHCEIGREPGGTAIAEQLRQLILQPGHEPLDALSELLLLFAARNQHLTQKIEPTLASGTWYVCDRFTDSTYAYQAGGRGMPKSQVQVLEQLVQGDMQPDCVFILDLSVEQRRQRLYERQGTDRLEAQSNDFHERVRAQYLARAQANPDSHRVIDAFRSLANVQQALKSHLDALITSHHG